MINDGVDQCGFAKSQNAYEKAFLQVFQGLDRVEYILSKKTFPYRISINGSRCETISNIDQI